MLSYLHTWTPAAFFLGTVVILTTPFLGLIVLLVVLLAVLAALAALAGAIIAAPYLLGRSAHRRWQERRSADQPMAVLSPAQHYNTQLAIREAEGGAR